jgi:hypothetical protein
MVVAGHPIATAAAASNLPTFSRPVISGIQGIGYEQDLRIDNLGQVYTSVPDGAPGGGDFIWHSIDRGKTFKWVPAAAPLTGRPVTACTAGGGGDTELATDTANNLYFNDLSLANFATSRSGDQGKTFTTSCAGVPSTAVDRQWYAVDGDPLTGGNIFMAFDQVLQSTPGTCSQGILNNQLVLSRSPLLNQGATAGIQFNIPNRISAQCNEGIMGNDEVSPVTHHVFVVHDSDQLDKLLMARCAVVDFTVDPSGLSCSDHLIQNLGAGFITGGNFPTMAIDKAGKLYALWEKAACNPCGNPPVGGAVPVGDTLLYLSTSTDEGNRWTAPRLVPTTGLHQNAYAWIGAGDSGRIGIAWYGTSDAPATGGPDAVTGDWTLDYMQSLDGGATFAPPVVASEHLIHRGCIQTILGGKACSDRTLGDFMQLRIGRRGEANIVYADSTSRVGNLFGTHAMFVRQNGGATLLAQNPVMCGVPAQTNRVFDPRGDATLDAAGVVGPNNPNLDILSSTMARVTVGGLPVYQIRMTVSDLTSLLPGPAGGGSVLVWSTQWSAPFGPNTGVNNGGHVYHAYMESVNGAAPTFWDGEMATDIANGGNGTVTYPGAHQITGSYTATAPGVITINVPLSDVSDPLALGSTLFSVTSSSMTLPAPAESQPVDLAGVGGVLFNLIDVVQAYDFIPGAQPPASGTTTCSTSPPPSPSAGGGGEEDNADDDRGIDDEEPELSLPTAILGLLGI